MRATILSTFSLIASLCAAEAVADATCPATTAEDPLFGSSIPGWYGTEALAVELSSPAKWSTTRPGKSSGERLFWRSAGFRPGTESDLKISIRSPDGAPVTGHISAATNAYIPSVQLGRPLTPAEGQDLATEAMLSSDGWRMLTGIDFPEAGCWEITASYLGQTLKFVVETVNFVVESVSGDADAQLGTSPQ